VARARPLISLVSGIATTVGISHATAAVAEPKTHSPQKTWRFLIMFPLDGESMTKPIELFRPEHPIIIY
jgi:hypothetical protein